MVATPQEVRLPGPGGPQISRVEDPSAIAETIDVAAAGFEAPRELFAALYTPAVLAVPGLSVYLLRIGGRAVSTADPRGSATGRSASSTSPRPRLSAATGTARSSPRTRRGRASPRAPTSPGCRRAQWASRCTVAWGSVKSRPTRCLGDQPRLTIWLRPDCRRAETRYPSRRFRHECMACERRERATTRAGPPGVSAADTPLPDSVVSACAHEAILCRYLGPWRFRRPKTTAVSRSMNAPDSLVEGAELERGGAQRPMSVEEVEQMVRRCPSDLLHGGRASPAAQASL